MSAQNNSSSPRPRLSEPAIAEEMLRMAGARGPEASFCPSEVARALVGTHPDTWGAAMVPVRRVAVQLAKSGKIVIYRKGKPVDPDDFRGVYRLGMPREE